MYIFYTETKVNKYIALLCYTAYFILITLVHTTIKIPIVVALSNVILIFLLTLLYSLQIRKNVLSVLLIYVTLTCAETLTVFLTGFINIDILSPYEYDSVFGIIVVRIVCFIAVLLFSSFKNIKSGYLIPRVYWMSLFIVPVGTIFLLFSSFLGDGLSKNLTIITIGSVLLINVTTFYLYDSISRLMAEKMDECLMEQQNKYYENQLDLMKDALRNTKTIQHDLRNKLSPIYTLALSGENEQLIESLAELTSLCIVGKEYANSGNSAIDSIINFKLQQIKEDDAQVSCEILIPSELNISSFDIAIILGNLIDNAVTGIKTIEVDRWIDIKIKYTKGRLIMTISNSFDGVVLENQGIIITRKQDEQNHGLGLTSVKTAIRKYNGAMDIHYINQKFKVKVLMYV
ncbi:MAG TPA: GHKL domain-containing protein, partial [Epulopiscium sp.]|nr:GHKL domain-containing protein [Candidatus Epulonipiscium sp.]